MKDFLLSFNPLPSKRCRSETEKKYSEDHFRSVLSLFKKYLPSRSIKFNNIGISQSLKLRILVEKSLKFLLSLISLQKLWAVMG